MDEQTNTEGANQSSIGIFDAFTTTIMEVNKGAILQKEGDKKQKSYLVKKGLLRSYTIDEKGREHIYMFAPEGWIVSDLEAQTSGEGCMLYIDCLEDSTVECLEQRHSEHFIKNTSEEEKNKQILSLLKRVAVLQKRVLLLMSASAKTRYLNFKKTYPNISQRVPQKMIASYLGITPEALSKIKSELLYES
jgi:CRP-like cAMP-binding protein